MTNLELAELTGISSVNTFTINSWTKNATLNGADNNDIYIVNLKGSGSGTTTINDSSGTDSLTVNGTSAVDALNISATQVTLGGETVNYVSTDSLVVNGLGSGDNIQISDTSILTTVNGGNGNDIISA